MLTTPEKFFHYKCSTVMSTEREIMTKGKVKLAKMSEIKNWKETLKCKLRKEDITFMK